MKERPILFKGPMVRAILEGRKTQTRRIIKPQPKFNFIGKIVDSLGYKASEDWMWAGFGNPFDPAFFKFPYGKHGDRLWVREAWRVNHQYDSFSPSDIQKVTMVEYLAGENVLSHHNKGKIRPSIHMPRWASRINLEITGIRVERLQDISPEDAMAEGLTALSKDGGRTIKYGIPDSDGLPGNDDHGWHWKEWCVDPREAYRKLWESINGPGSWDLNPWVWVVEFKRVSP